MKKRGIILFLIAMFTAYCVFAADYEVSRTFSAVTVSPGESVTVNLYVEVGSNPKSDAYAIDETVPAGWTITNADGGDTSESQHLKWVVCGETTNPDYDCSGLSCCLPSIADRTYSYVITAPSSAGSYTFSGEYLFDVQNGQAAKTILGDNVVVVEDSASCSSYTTSTACDADTSCSWCPLSDTCLDSASVVCTQSGCLDSASVCGSNCQAVACGTGEQCTAGACSAIPSNCDTYTTSTACDADTSCSWCPLSGSCKIAEAVICTQSGCYNTTSTCGSNCQPTACTAGSVCSSGSCSGSTCVPDWQYTPWDPTDCPIDTRQQTRIKYDVNNCLANTTETRRCSVTTIGDNAGADSSGSSGGSTRVRVPVVTDSGQSGTSGSASSRIPAGRTTGGSAASGTKTTSGRQPVISDTSDSAKGNMTEPEKLEAESKNTDLMFYGLLAILIVLGIVIFVFYKSSSYNKPGSGHMDNMQLIQQQQQMIQNQNNMNR